MRPDGELVGDNTGRTWRFWVARSIGFERWHAVADDDESEAMLVCREKGGGWQDEVDGMRRAIRIASVPEVAAAPTIRHFIDLRDTPEEVMMLGDAPMTLHGRLCSVWEWADISLHDLIQDLGESASAAADAVEESVTAALKTLHAVNIVHCDVAPNNILRVAGGWKLADLDACRERGEIADRLPRNERYVHPDRRADELVNARDDFDWYGLVAILGELRG